MAFTEPVLTKRIPLDPSKRHLVGYDEYVATGGYASLRKALEMGPEQIIKTTIDSGLRGRGGAGFSAGQKWSFIPKEKKGPHYLAVNADESEPGTFKDHYLIDYDPHQMLEGIAICALATQIDVAYIFIRGEYHREAKVLERALKEAYAAGVFGQQGIFGSKAYVTKHFGYVEEPAPTTRPTTGPAGRGGRGGRGGVAAGPTTRPTTMMWSPPR